MRRSPSPASTLELSSAASPDDLDGALGDPGEQEGGRNSHRIPAGLFAAALATLIALPILLSDGNSGALEIETIASSVTTATSSPPSSEADVDIDEAPDEPPARTGAGAAQLAAAASDDGETETSPSSTAPTAASPTTASPTTASPSRVAPTAAPTTAAPTTAAPTTAAPTTAAPTTAAPTSAAPVTAAPTTPAQPAPVEPSDAVSPTNPSSPTPGPGPEAPETTPEEQTTETTAPATPTTAAPTTAAPTTAAPTTAAPSTAAPVPAEPTAAQWQVLRQCESGDNYSIVSSNGLYYGAYQFHQDTWNSVARSAGRTDLVNIQPHHAGPPDQDAMALQLWRQRGWSPWPTCGKKAAAA